MISDATLEKLSQPPLKYKSGELAVLEAIENGINNYDVWFLKLLQGKVPFLNIVSEDRLSDVGEIIIKNLPYIKTYNGIITILQSLYENSFVQVTSSKQGTIDINITNNGDILDTLEYSNGDDFVFQDGYELGLSGYTAENITSNYQDFLQQFILAGVHINKLSVDKEIVYQSYISGTDILISGENLIGGIKNG